MEKPFISVIVTAYNRKQFILEALNSIINQTLSRDKYEVIVTKNFEDKDIDKFISDNDMKNILFTEPGIGPRLADAIKVCQGDVITFLEDDDIWSKDRLERVYNVFKNYDVGFYHNTGIHNKLDEDYSGLVKQLGVTDQDNYKIIDYPYKEKAYLNNLGNNSSIAVAKDTVIKYLDKIYICELSVDLFLLLIVFIEKVRLFIDFNSLTFIRVHKRGRTLEEEIKYEGRSLKDLFDGFNLAKTYNSTSGVGITKRQIFLLITWRGMLKNESRAAIIKDAIKFFPGFKFVNKPFIKRAGLFFIYLIIPRYANAMVIKRLKIAGQII